ncbi:MAG: hypothetical protein KAS39_03550, partial [Actinomycetia bacterium]|nr:hypothetical protein [Actinomycetes bacterium]
MNFKTTFFYIGTIAVFFLLFLSTGCLKKTTPPPTNNRDSINEPTVTGKNEKEFNIDTNTYISAKEAYAIAVKKINDQHDSYKLYTIIGAFPIDSFMDLNGKANHWTIAFYFPKQKVTKLEAKTVNIEIDKRYSKDEEITEKYFTDKIYDNDGNLLDIPNNWKDSSEIMDI